jgi:hypothetical protein
MNITNIKGISASLIIMFCLLTALSTGCRKSNDKPDDPNIYDRLIDSVSVSPGPGQPTRNVAIDLDNDGGTDFYLAAGETTPGVITTGLVGVQRYVNFLIDDSGLDSGYVAPSDENALIDSVSVPRPPRPHASWSDYAIGSVVTGSGKLGEANGTDFFLGVFTTKIDGVHYGWLKLNIASDGKSIRLKELAVFGRPRTPIKAGAI